MNAIKKIIAAGFVLELDGVDLVIEPFSKLAPNQLAFLKSHKAEIIQELKGYANHAPQQQAVNDTQELSRTDKAKIEAWLSSIGEKDPVMIDDVLNQCRTDAAALIYFLKRACETVVVL